MGNLMAADKSVTSTPKQTRRWGPQSHQWHPHGPLPNAYMSPVDFALSPMSMRLLRGKPRKVFVSGNLMGLSEHPGFTEEYTHASEPNGASEDKENCGAVGNVAGKKVEIKSEKKGGLAKKGLSPATMNTQSPKHSMIGGKRHHCGRYWKCMLVEDLRCHQRARPSCIPGDESWSSP